ncbi:YafY family transcriptional regulator [Burkholderia seminalis]|uniref:helix-turn-helix transcriptional regulator n=1 Tax=Burkholderia TaxID=32008 RepID=UPI000F5984D1|nr:MULTISPECIES: YafY family protein [Burkholderia]MBN3738234.1 YafY family transcriptional regulator [Burkholderia sp. Tr-20355]MCA8424998.1 YafY family transcriptional regulator [Burkholderia seminalis]RQS78680.1 YafY family transcriptional regulator [Burkholderia seminalis]
MKASRLLSIMMMLQARGRMTAPALAEALEVSERTILRDIDQLSTAGVPIWGERGRNGGFQLRDGWRTDLTGLTEHEARALILAGLPGPASELGLDGMAASARLKMIASLPPASREQADRVASRLHVDTVDWYRAQETPAFLREAADAVWGAYCIDVTYQSWRGVSRRALEPLGLVLKGGAWYLIARVVGKPAALTFRLANIREFNTTRRRFRRPARFDLAAHWRDAMNRVEADLHRLTAHVALSPRGATWLANARIEAAPAGHEAGNADVPPGWNAFLMPIESIEHGARKLLGFGAHVKILGPQALKDRFLDELSQLNALYRSVGD